MYTYKCPQCGSEQYSSEPKEVVTCQRCGCQYNPNFKAQNNNQGYNNAQQSQSFIQPDNLFVNGPSGRSRGVAAILAILLGTFGAHYFYVGKNTAGILFLLGTVLSCGILATVLYVISIIQGVIMLTLTMDEFENRYINNPATLVF